MKLTLCDLKTKKMRLPWWDREYYIQLSGDTLYLFIKNIVVEEFNIIKNPTRFLDFQSDKWEECVPVLKLSDLNAGDKFRAFGMDGVYTIVDVQENLQVIGVFGKPLPYVYVKTNNNKIYGTNEDKEITKVE